MSRRVRKNSRSQFQKHRALQLKSTWKSKSNLVSVPNGEPEARGEVRLTNAVEQSRLLSARQAFSLLPHSVPGRDPSAEVSELP